MQLYTQDKAIEFNAVYNDIKRVINNLQKSGLNLTNERTKLKTIKQQCEQEVTKEKDQANIELIYQNGINELNKLKETLEEQKVYYLTYMKALNMEKELKNENPNEEKIKAFAQATIALITKIEESDTREFNTEKEVVEKIYNLAYDIIKQELICYGTSSLLNWIKENKIASSYINNLIENDIAILNNEIYTNDFIREIITKIEENSINISYLNEILILFIALQNKKNIDKIEKDLLVIIDELTNQEKIMTDNENGNKELEQTVINLKEKIKKSKIYKELGLTISLIAFLFGLKYDSNKIALNIGHKEYKTTFDFYSSDINSDKPEYPEYMEKVSNFNKTTLTAYDVWRQEFVFYGDYKRKIVTYDLSNEEYNTLEDLLTIDFSNRRNNEETEKVENIDVNELYDQAIIEIIHIEQDENDSIFIPNEGGKKVFLVTMSIISCIIGLGGAIAILQSIIKKCKSTHEIKLSLRKTTEELKEGLIAYQRLCNENENIKANFIANYERFKEYLDNKQIKKEYLNLERKKGE